MAGLASNMPAERWPRFHRSVHLLIGLRCQTTLFHSTTGCLVRAARWRCRACWAWGASWRLCDRSGATLAVVRGRGGSPAPGGGCCADAGGGPWPWATTAGPSPTTGMTRPRRCCSAIRGAGVGARAACGPSIRLAWGPAIWRPPRCSRGILLAHARACGACVVDDREQRRPAVSPATSSATRCCRWSNPAFWRGNRAGPDGPAVRRGGRMLDELPPRSGRPAPARWPPLGREATLGSIRRPAGVICCASRCRGPARRCPTRTGCGDRTRQLQRGAVEGLQLPVGRSACGLSRCLVAGARPSRSLRRRPGLGS